LYLPPAEARAFIFQKYFKSGHEIVVLSNEKK
jgi:hypothetical protein